MRRLHVVVEVMVVLLVVEVVETVVTVVVVVVTVVMVEVTVVVVMVEVTMEVTVVVVVMVVEGRAYLKVGMSAWVKEILARLGAGVGEPRWGEGQGEARGRCQR